MRVRTREMGECSYVAVAVSVSARVHSCVSSCQSLVKFVCLVCTLHHTDELIPHSGRACVKPLQTEHLVSPVGVISSEAHPFVTHSSVCPSPLSPTSGPIMSLLHTWLCFLLPSDFKAPLAGCSHRN